MPVCFRRRQNLDHRIGSSDRIIGSDHRIGSDRIGSSDRIIGSDHGKITQGKNNKKIIILI